jgi:hypothetical protein
MLMGIGTFEGVDNQLQYPLQAYQLIAIAGTRDGENYPQKNKRLWN